MTRDARILWERDEALTTLASILEGARGGVGRALFFIGDSGVGKTSVLQEARTQSGGEFDVGFGRGEVMEGGLPFGVAAQVFESFGAKDLTRLFERADSELDPSAPYYETLHWLESRPNRPALLAIDDLQWSDLDSLKLFGFLARRLDRVPVAMIGATRAWPQAAKRICRELADDGRAELVRLLSLTRPSAAAMLRARTQGNVASDVEDRAWELCRGNPLLIEQVALTVRRGEGLPAASSGAGAMPELILLSRFSGLDAAGLRCAQAASVMGTSFRTDVTAEIAGLDEAIVEEAFEGMARGGLAVRTGAAAMRFAHPWFAQALYEDLSEALRARFHTGCFHALARRGMEAEAAAHASRAGLIGDHTAIALLERAGRAALAAGASASAARHFGAAVELSGDSPEATLLLGYAEALLATGHLQEAAAACRRLDGDVRVGWSERIQMLRLLGRTQYLLGEPDHGDKALSDAVALAIEHDPVQAVQPLLDQSLSAWLAGGPAKALPFAATARKLASGAPEELRERAAAAWGHLAMESGDPEGVRATEVARHWLTDEKDRRLDGVELTWPWASILLFANNAIHAERFDDAELAFARARAAAERAGAANALATLSIYRVNLLIRRGELAAAWAESSRAAEFADITPGVLGYVATVQAELHLWFGRFSESEAACRLVEQFAAGQWFARLWVAHVRGLRLLWQGDRGASDQFLLAEELTNGIGVREPCMLQWAGHAVAAHLAAERWADAERVVQWLEDCAPSLPCAWPRMSAALGRARLAWRDGNTVEADRFFADALALCRSADLPLQRAELLLAYGTYRRRLGQLVEARPLLAEAANLAASAGATWLAATAQAELRLAGGRRRSRGGGEPELTSAERRVADLAAEGRSNADIARILYLSVNTVETHLKRVYAKLGLGSRRELMRTWPRTDAPG
jgi:DNA-binding CsgD family transcriptional regulator